MSDNKSGEKRESGVVLRRRDEEIPEATLRTLPDEKWSLPWIFHHRALHDPNQEVLYQVSVSRSGLEAETVRYGELLQQVRGAADKLAGLGAEEGDRVVLMIRSPSDFLAWFFAAMGLGLIPVPLPPVGKFGISEAFRLRINGVARDCDPRVIIADGAERCVEQKVGQEFTGHWVDPTQALDTDRSTPDDFDLDRSLDEIAYLQYTSGSTGEPKGVVVTHGNLVANLRASTLAGHFSDQDRCVSWLPLYHDMGLIGGPLLGIYLNGAPYLMDPVDFILSPISWLEALDHFKATFTVAPNFAYSIAAHKLRDKALEKLDFSSLRLAFNGAEPIDHRTVKRFMERFEPLGFEARALYPVYGLAEATLAVAFPHPSEQVEYDRVGRKELTSSGHALSGGSEQDDGVTFVSVGQVVSDHEVVIRDRETGELCGERELGEVCVRGPSVSPGYFGHLDDAQQENRELATGDLGYIADDRLFVVDRIKDLIIVGGRNFAPSDIEHHSCRVEGIRRGAVVAFGLVGEYSTEELYLVAEFDPRSMRSTEDVERELRQIVRAGFELTVAEVLFVPPHSLPKTSSGKIRRHEARRMFVEQEFESMSQLGTRLSAVGRYAKGRVRRWVATNLQS